MKYLTLLFVALVVAACGTAEKSTSKEEPPYTKAKPKADWVAKRVAAAETRLQSSEAGRLVWNAIEYHGGLTNWWSNGPLYFRFNYRPKPGTGQYRDTYETADYWRSITRHQRVENTVVEYGWDGEQAWYSPDTATIPYNTRFWALTPYYFAGMPFLFADEGVNLALEAPAEYEGETYHIVRVTFGDGVGDAPDDFYVLYIDQETYRLAAIRYVVSYPGYFPNGGHTQEKLMTYEGEQKVNGIIFPQKHRTFMWEADGSIGKYVTDITLSDLEFRPETEQSYFEIPEEAYVFSGLLE